MQNNWKKYASVFLITAAIFFTAFYISNSLNQKRVAEIRNIESKISVDILSSETQFDLLSESSCKDIAGQTTLSEEMESLGDQLAFTEERLGSDDEEVLGLKKYYSLLQIKDYLLMKKITQKCGEKPLTILYFYSNKGDCPKCEGAGNVLTYLRNEYPEMRVYSFDYNLALSAVSTLISILKVNNNLPAIVVGNDQVYYGLTNLSQFEGAVPELKTLKLAKERAATLRAAATSTKATSTAQ